MKKLIFLLLLFSQHLLADYYRTGQVKGEDCTFGIICKWYSVDAVEGEDGKLYNLNKVYPNVSSYRSGKNSRCWIDNSLGHEWGVLGYAFDSAFRPNFYTKKNGKLIKKSFDQISFPCVKR